MQSVPILIPTLEAVPITTPEPTPSADQLARQAAKQNDKPLAIGQPRTWESATGAIFWPDGATPWTGACSGSNYYSSLIEAAAKAAGADPTIMSSLIDVEGSGERAVSPAGAMGIMQLMPDKFQPGDDPFDVKTNLLRGAELVARLQRSYSQEAQIAAAYFGAIDGAGNVTGASDGNVTGFEYVRRFQAALDYHRAITDNSHLLKLLSPLTTPLGQQNISFGFRGDYGLDLALEIRGAGGVASLGTEHLAWDIIIPGTANNGRGSPVFAPFSGRIVLTSDPAGGPNGIWLENASLDLRARIMHMDALAYGLTTGTCVNAGQKLGILGAQGTEGFPHLHLGFERLSTGERIDPDVFYRLGVPMESAPHLADSRDLIRIRVPSGQVLGAPAVNGGRVVWSDLSSGRPRLDGLALQTGQHFKAGADGSTFQTAPALSGNSLVWLESQAGAASDQGQALTTLFVQDLTTGNVKQLTDQPGRYGQPSVDGQVVVWTETTPDGTAIRAANLATGERFAIATAPGFRAWPTISGSTVVWSEWPDASAGASLADLATKPADLRAFDLKSRQTATIAQGSAVGQPSLSGSLVVWREHPALQSTSEEVCAAATPLRSLNLATGLPAPLPADARTITAPVVSGSLVSWQGCSSSAGAPIQGFDLADGRSFTFNPGDPAAIGPAAQLVQDGQTVFWTNPGGENATLSGANLLTSPVSGGRFFARTAVRHDEHLLGQSVTNDPAALLYSAFRALGDSPLLGVPVSNRFTLLDGLIYQATESALLQWNPVANQANLANTFDILHDAGKDDWLTSQFQVPPQAPDLPTGDWDAIRTGRLAFLTDPAIESFYRATPDVNRYPNWSQADSIRLYGLPASKPMVMGDSVVQRFQRAVLRRPNSGPQTATVEALPVGPILLQSGLIAQDASQPQPQP
jgi:murein DD-endopeptidase MepM/ murein hydrolase activator NlpD